MKKIILGIIYSIISVFWLSIAVLFTSALWLEKPGTNDWKEDSMFIPIGIIMLIIWVITLIALIYSFRSKNKTSEINSDSKQITKIKFERNDKHGYDNDPEDTCGSCRT